MAYTVLKLTILSRTNIRNRKKAFNMVTTVTKEEKQIFEEDSRRRNTQEILKKQTQGDIART